MSLNEKKKRQKTMLKAVVNQARYKIIWESKSMRYDKKQQKQSANKVYHDNGEQQLDFEVVCIGHFSELIECIHRVEPRLAVQVAIPLDELRWSILAEADVFKLGRTAFQLPLRLL